MIVASITIFNSCVSCGGNDDSLYDEEYWNSVGREKAMRKAGLTSRADIEKDERQSRLKKMKANPSSKSSNVSVNMGQDQGEISYDGVGAERTQNNWIYLLLVCIGILALGAAAFFVWHRRELAFQTAEGSVRSGSKGISRKGLIHEIRRSTLHPSGDTFSAVLEQINKQKQ